jgi:hypothetical protein
MNGGRSGSVAWIARGLAAAVAGGGTGTIAGGPADDSHSRQSDDADGTRRKHAVRARAAGWSPAGVAAKEP